MFLQIFLSSLIIIVIILHFIMKKKYSYWKQRNVIYEEPRFLFGNYGSYVLQQEYNGYLGKRLSKKYKNEPYFGGYFGTSPVLIVKDLELVKAVLTKDFNHFNSRELMDYSDKEPMGRSIAFCAGETWKTARAIMSPMFSSSKMKNMFPLVKKCCERFEVQLENLKEEQVEMRQFISNFTMDSIVSCAFGVDFDKMEKKGIFRKIGNLVFNLNVVTFSCHVLRAMFPGFFYGIKLKAAPMVLKNFFGRFLEEVFKSRDYKPSPRHDFVDLMLLAKQTNPHIDTDFILAQSAAMFLAGYETSANTMSYVLYELSKHPELQERAIQEVDDYLAKHDNQLDYDCTTELTFLDACMQESLRLYPVLGIITREVSKEYTLPSGLVLERGLRVHIPAYYLHHNEEYFPEPETFRPERFLPENRDSVMPYSFLPFGEGPRNCVGSRFAKMQVMAGLITILKRYRAKLGLKMKREIRLEPKSLSTLAVGGIWLTLELRSDK